MSFEIACPACAGAVPIQAPCTLDMSTFQILLYEQPPGRARPAVSGA